MEFEIELPEVNIKKEIEEAGIRRILTEDKEKGGILAKVLVFIYLKKVTSITELTDALTDYYHVVFDRANVWRAVEKLVKMRVVHKVTSGYVLSMPPSEMKEIHKLILEKHRIYLERLPNQFRQKYNDVNYVWVSNGLGENQIPWACKLLGFECKEKK